MNDDLLLMSCVFCFKQKTVYDMRISDWSSDVCSSDLSAPSRVAGRMLIAPSGKMSHSASTSPMMIAPNGVIDAGFITNGQPIAIAGAILCAARLSGKLKEIGRAHV